MLRGVGTGESWGWARGGRFFLAMGDDRGTHRASALDRNGGVAPGDGGVLEVHIAPNLPPEPQPVLPPPNRVTDPPRHLHQGQGQR